MKRVQIYPTILQQDIGGLIQRLLIRANRLYKRQRSRNDLNYWMARGRQQVLTCVATRLQEILEIYDSDYALYLSMREYCECLNKWVADAIEERRTPACKGQVPISQWKAQGEAAELELLIQELSSAIEPHTPDVIAHTLSLSGQELIPLSEGDEQEHVSAPRHSQAGLRARSIPMNVVGSETRVSSKLCRHCR